MSYLLLWLTLAGGLTGKIQGTVQDETTGQPIPYADVVITNTEIGTATDDQGNFFILNILPGKYIIEISCLGYQAKRIENIIVEIDQTVRLKVSLKPSAIEMAPVVISGTMPSVKKDMVGTTYIIRQSEISTLPVDYIERLIAFQPAVANVDTALHIRGGRATEVLYMIDNVSIIDPQTGDPAINISKGIIDEVIFLPGGFDVEYGRAMSGVVNLITEHPRDKLSGRFFAKTETIMPFYYDFGYQDYHATVHLPVSKRFKGLLTADLMHTDDWDPRLYILPHKQRDDYALYTKWIYHPMDKINIFFSASRSRSQFDRYATNFKYYLENYRSDFREGDLMTLNMYYLPNTKTLVMLTLSRLNTEKIYGVRLPESNSVFHDFVFKRYTLYQYPHGGYKNPFGVYYYKFRIEGDYPEYEDKNSLIRKFNCILNKQINKNHEMKVGFEFSHLKIHNFTYFISSDSLDPIDDPYTFYPKEYNLFIQDNIDYEGFYAKIGFRGDYFNPGKIDNQSKLALSPRIGFSFMVTDKFLFRTNIGKYVQPPLYDQMYKWYNKLPFPTYVYYFKSFEPIGNPTLNPEQTVSYEIGFQGQINPHVTSSLNAFYKDVSGLIGTRYQRATPYGYISYFNVEYAIIKGVEMVWEFPGTIFDGKISYSLSWSRGTSSYADEIWSLYYRENFDTTFIPPQKEYYLDFDQRNRIFVQGTFKLPCQIKFYLNCYLGNGFPYTPPGPEGKYNERNIARMPFQNQINILFSKPIKIGRFILDGQIEIMNLLDTKYEISPHQPFSSYESIHKEDFDDFYSISAPMYHPAADINHDGLITPYEEYTAFMGLLRSSDDWINAYTSPRRARIGLTMNF